MNPSGWHKVEELFHAALQLPPVGREAFLASHANADPSLIAQVRDLLTAHDGVHPLLDAPPAAALPTGMRLGPYELQSILGAGGMGTVYLARRADAQFEKQVAVKLVNLGLAAEISGTRFQRERQILAQLEHPNIARLLDAGLSEFGQPYLVMEWVDGVPLDEWISRHNPSMNRRLDLWLQIAATVSYAHRNLIVHRDLKPSNILVTAEGIPKLVDFGIAKLLGQDAGETAQTQIFTPLYASPEQISGAPVTTATDVYSLGILLCELVAGAHPFRREGQSSLEAAQAVLREEAAVPATVPADLAAILSKALRKEPNRRYLTADQFAEDLERYRQGKPVSAQPETRIYRARKFISRNRIGVSIAAIVAAAMITLTTVALLQAQRATQQLARAEKVTEFLSGIMGVAPSGEEAGLRTRGASLRVVELVDSVAARMDRQLAGQPEAEASLRYVLGSAYNQMGLYAKAEPQVRRAVELFQRLYPPQDRQRLNAAILSAHLDMNLGRFPDSEQALLEVDRLWKDPPPYAGAAIATVLAISQFRQGKLDAAERRLLDCLAMLERTVGPGDLWIGVVLSNLSLIYQDRGQFEQAISHLERGVAVARARASGPSESLAWPLVNLANVHRYVGNHDQTRRFAEEARLQFAGSLGESNPAIVHALAAIAWAKAAAGEPDEPLIRRGVAVQEASLPVGHNDRAVGQTFLGFVLMTKGKLPEAHAALEKALAIRKKNFSAPNWRIAETEGFLGEVLARQGNLSAARGHLANSAAAFSTLYGPDNPRTREAQQRLERWSR